MRILLSSRSFGGVIRQQGLEAFVQVAGGLPGVCGVEMRARDLPGVGEDLAWALRQMTARAGLSVPLFSIETDFGHHDRVEREKEMESISNWAALGAKTGAQALCLSSGTLHGRERDFVELVRCLMVSALLTEGEGLLMVVENDRAQDGLIRSLTELENLIDSIETPNAAMAVDVTALTDKPSPKLGQRMSQGPLFWRLWAEEEDALARLSGQAVACGFTGWLVLDAHETKTEKEWQRVLEKVKG